MDKFHAFSVDITSRGFHGHSTTGHQCSGRMAMKTTGHARDITGRQQGEVHPQQKIDSALEQTRTHHQQSIALPIELSRLDMET